MKFNFSTLLKSTLAIGFAFSFYTCGTQSGGAGTSPVSIVQNTLNNGLSAANMVFKDKNQFLTNTLVEAVLPEELKSINSKLESLGLQSIVEKEKAYIAEVAGKAIVAASPLIKESIASISPADAVAILAGSKTSGTNFLRNSMGEKLEAQLNPMVQSELSKLGFDKLINTALLAKGGSLNQLAGSILGIKTGSSANTQNQLSGLVTKQLVDGIFTLIEEKEKSARSNVFEGLRSVIGSPSE